MARWLQGWEHNKKFFRPSFECIFNVCPHLEMKSKAARRIPGHFAEATMAATLCMKVPVSHITIFCSLSEVRQQYWHTKYSRRPFPKKEQKRKKITFSSCSWGIPRRGRKAHFIVLTISPFQSVPSPHEHRWVLEHRWLVNCKLWPLVHLPFPFSPVQQSHPYCTNSAVNLCILQSLESKLVRSFMEAATHSQPSGSNPAETQSFRRSLLSLQTLQTWLQSACWRSRSYQGRTDWLTLHMLFGWTHYWNWEVVPCCIVVWFYLVFTSEKRNAA